MKTTKYFPMLRSFIKTALISITMIASSIDSYGQNSAMSFQITSNISGSGLGANICPSIALTNNKSTFSIGPNFQRAKFNLSGIQFNYRYSAGINPNGKLELYFSGNLTIQNSAYMSRGNIELEESCHPEGKCNYNDLRLKVVEGYAGIGLQINPVKCFSIATGAGLGVFDTLNKGYDRELYRQKSGFVLQLKCSLIYHFKAKEYSDKKNRN